MQATPTEKAQREAYLIWMKSRGFLRYPGDSNRASGGRDSGDPETGGVPDPVVAPKSPKALGVFLSTPLAENTMQELAKRLIENIAQAMRLKPESSRFLSDPSQIQRDEARFVILFGAQAWESYKRETYEREAYEGGKPRLAFAEALHRIQQDRHGEEEEGTLLLVLPSSEDMLSRPDLKRDAWHAIQGLMKRLDGA